MFDVLTYGVRSFAFLCVGASLLPGKMCVRRDTRAAFQQATNAVTAALSGDSARRRRASSWLPPEPGLGSVQANPNPNHTACPRVSLQLTAGLADRRNTLKSLPSGTESILALAHSPMPVESDEDDEAEAVQAAEAEAGS